jgi:hypothetical protein
MDGIRAGKAFVEFVLSDKKFNSKLSKVAGKLRKFGAIGIAATAPLIAGFAAAVKSFASAGDALDKMRHRIGVSVEALSGLVFAAEQSGASGEILEKGFAGLSRSLFDAKRGSAEAVDALGELGLSFADLERLSPEEQFKRVADGMSRLSNESVQGAVAQKLFGRAGRQLLPLLKTGAKGINALQQEASDLGFTLTNEDAVAAAKLTDALNALWNQVRGVAIQVGAAIAGPLTEFIGWAQAAMAVVIDFVRENRTLIAVIAAVTVAVATVSAGMIALGTAVVLYSAAAAGATAITAGFGIALAAITRHPIIAFLTGVIALVVAGATALGWFSDSASELDKTLKPFKDGKFEADIRTRSENVQSELQGAVRSSSSAAVVTRSSEAPVIRDSSGEVAKWTRETAEGVARLVAIAKRGGLMGGAF